MPNTANGKTARAQRKQIADQNALARSERTNAEQVSELDNRLGVGIGAVKERAQLATQDA